MIYADFGSILVPEYNGKENTDDSKYQKYVACMLMIIKLICVDEKFR